MASSNYQNSKTRTLLGKQPARTLLIDSSNSMSCQENLVDDLTNALENVFSVACSIGGPSRVPLFSVIALAEYPETLLPLSHVKNNYDRIQTSVSELRKIIHNCNQTADKSCITEGIQEACGQFRRQIQQQRIQTGGMCQQLELIIITCRGNEMQKYVEEIATTLHLDSLKRIQVVSISCLEGLYGDGELNSSQNSTLSNSSNNSITCGLVDMINIYPDSLSMQNFFNTWLLDTSTDCEHLHIVLPAPGDYDTGDSEFVIKCDIQERIFNPAQLPFYEHFTIHSDSASMKTFPTTSKALGMSIPVHRIKIVSLIAVSSICDSVVFGMPMIAEATRCWKIDWDELEKNQQIFKALCYSLNEKDQAMIGHLDYITITNINKRPMPSVIGNTSQMKPKGHFVLIPSPNGTFLIKSLAVREMVLPFQAASNLDGLSEDAFSTVTESLEKVHVTDIYNPFMWSSGLYESLKNKQRKTDPNRQKKRSNSNNCYSGDPLNQSNLDEPKKKFEFSTQSKKKLQQNKNTSEEIESTRHFPQKSGTSKKSKTIPLLPFPTDL